MPAPEVAMQRTHHRHASQAGHGASCGEWSDVLTCEDYIAQVHATNEELKRELAECRQRAESLPPSDGTQPQAPLFKVGIVVFLAVWHVAILFTASSLDEQMRLLTETVCGTCLGDTGYTAVYMFINLSLSIPVVVFLVVPLYSALLAPYLHQPFPQDMNSLRQFFYKGPNFKNVASASERCCCAGHN